MAAFGAFNEFAELVAEHGFTVTPTNGKSLDNFGGRRHPLGKNKWPQHEVVSLVSARTQARHLQIVTY